MHIFSQGSRVALEIRPYTNGRAIRHLGTVVDMAEIADGTTLARVEWDKCEPLPDAWHDVGLLVPA